MSPDFVIDGRYKCERLIQRSAAGWCGWSSDLRARQLVLITTGYGEFELRELLGAHARLRDRGLAAGPSHSGWTPDGSWYVVAPLPADAMTVAELDPDAVGVLGAVHVALACTQLLLELYEARVRVAGAVIDSMLVSPRGSVQVCGIAAGRDHACRCEEVLSMLGRFGYAPDAIRQQLRRHQHDPELCLRELSSILTRMHHHLRDQTAGAPRGVSAFHPRFVARRARPRRAGWKVPVLAGVLTLILMGGASAYAVELASQRTFPVPDAVGAGAINAAEVLREQGWTVDVVPVYSPAQEDQVLRQRPAAGRGLRRGETITLIASQGPAPIKVPVLAGQVLLAAEYALQSRGLRSTAVQVDGGVAGRVIGTLPEAGSPIRKGDEVTITYGRGPAAAGG